MHTVALDRRVGNVVESSGYTILGTWLGASQMNGSVIHTPEKRLATV